MKTTILILLSAVSIAHADLIADVTFTGDFTLNHLYDFNNPGAQPFGTLSEETVTGSTGLFAPFLHAGQSVAGQLLWTANTPPLFTLGGFTMLTEFVGVYGPDSGQLVVGYTELTGNGYQFDLNHSLWIFSAPPYDISNFPSDITGPITMEWRVFNDVFNTPEGGSTIALMGLAMLGLFVIRKIFFKKGVD